jgi:hypothetical protein
VIRIPRWVVGLLGVLFAGFHAVLGFTTIPTIADPFDSIFALVLYLGTVLPTIVLYRGVRLPNAQAIINLAAAALIPILVDTYLLPEDLTPYSTWYVMGVATLMAATAVRQQLVIAWVGTCLLILQVINWGGIIIGIQAGLLGATMLVFAGHAISVGLAKAYRDTMAFTLEALENEKQKIANAVASEVRRSRLEKALAGALPMLNLIRESKGSLSDFEKSNARLLEAELRDEIRGRDFMSEEIKGAIRAARARGVEVVVLDEGGLADLSLIEKSNLLEKIVSAISKVQEGRITLRSPQGEEWKATLVASRPGVSSPDLWLKF